jgi:predicted transcriptional regulator of viral defense system
MQEINNNSKIKEIFQKNNGYITRRQIDENNIYSWFLTDFVKKENLQKIDKGFYADEKWIQDDFLIFQYKYPKFIYSYESALFLLEMTDNLPSSIEVTGPKNYRPFNPKNSDTVIHTDSSDETYNLGITEIKTNLGNIVRTYNAEKTICDLIKKQSFIDSETFLKALHNYAKMKNKNTNKLMEYAAVMGIEKKVSDIMLVVLNENQ